MKGMFHKNIKMTIMQFPTKISSHNKNKLLFHVLGNVNSQKLQIFAKQNHPKLHKNNPITYKNVQRGLCRNARGEGQKSRPSWI